MITSQILTCSPKIYEKLRRDDQIGKFDTTIDVFIYI